MNEIKLLLAIHDAELKMVSPVLKRKLRLHGIPVHRVQFGNGSDAYRQRRRRAYQSLAENGLLETTDESGRLVYVRLTDAGRERVAGVELPDEIRAENSREATIADDDWEHASKRMLLNINTKANWHSKDEWWKWAKSVVAGGNLRRFRDASVAIDQPEETIDPLWWMWSRLGIAELANQKARDDSDEWKKWALLKYVNLNRRKVENGQADGEADDEEDLQSGNLPEPSVCDDREAIDGADCVS